MKVILKKNADKNRKAMVEYNRDSAAYGITSPTSLVTYYDVIKDGETIGQVTQSIRWGREEITVYDFSRQTGRTWETVDSLEEAKKFFQE